MRENPHPELSRRERQVLDIVYAHGRASAQEVRAAMSDPPSYSSVRTVLRLLEQKGHLRHESDGPRHVYIPVVKRERARRKALKHLMRTFFEDSPKEVVNELLDVSGSKLSRKDLDELQRLIKQAKEEGR